MSARQGDEGDVARRGQSQSGSSMLTRFLGPFRKRKKVILVKRTRILRLNELADKKVSCSGCDRPWRRAVLGCNSPATKWMCKR
eukprot:symbB.v1.2.013704.t1/scaffold974.1/size359025/11